MHGYSSPMSHSSDSRSSGGVSRHSLAEFPFLNPTQFEFQCVYPECPKTFSLTNDLYDHIRGHSKILMCSICDRKYKCMASLVYHVRTHTGSKPYICPLPCCKFETATKGNLKAHLLSNQHKDAMSLALLNVILSLDTKHGRPESQLHAPRERKKRRNIVTRNAAGVYSIEGPPRKRSRSAASFPMLRMQHPLEFGQLERYSEPRLINPQDLNLPPLPQTPFDHELALLPPQTGSGVAPAFFGPMTPMGPTMAPLYSATSTSNFYSPLGVPQPLAGETSGTMMSPETAGMWENFGFMPPPQPLEEDEDLTVRIKLGLLQSIENADAFRDINEFGDGDQFSLAIDGVESTKVFYAENGKFTKSSFRNMTNLSSGSGTPAFNMQREASSEGPGEGQLKLIEPPLIF